MSTYQDFDKCRSTSLSERQIWICAYRSHTTNAKDELLPPQLIPSKGIRKTQLNLLSTIGFCCYPFRLCEQRKKMEVKRHSVRTCKYLPYLEGIRPVRPTGTGTESERTRATIIDQERDLCGIDCEQTGYDLLLRSRQLDTRQSKSKMRAVEESFCSVDFGVALSQNI